MKILDVSDPERDRDPRQLRPGSVSERSLDDGVLCRRRHVRGVALRALRRGGPLRRDRARRLEPRRSDRARAPRHAGVGGGGRGRRLRRDRDRLHRGPQRRPRDRRLREPVRRHALGARAARRDRPQHDRLGHGRGDRRRVSGRRQRPVRLRRLQPGPARGEREQSRVAAAGRQLQHESDRKPARGSPGRHAQRRTGTSRSSPPGRRGCSRSTSRIPRSPRC